MKKLILFLVLALASFGYTSNQSHGTIVIGDGTNTVGVNTDGSMKVDTSSGTIKISDGTNIADVAISSSSAGNLDEANGLVTNAILNGRISDSAVRAIEIDDSTHAISTIEYEHHEIHAGSHYFVGGYTTLDLGQKIDFCLQTENSTNRNSIKTTNLVNIQADATVAAVGTLIDETQLGSATNPNRGIPGGGNRNRELILKQGENYVFRLTSLVNSNVITYLGEWYEHTDKN